MSVRTLGDVVVDSTIRFKFTTSDGSGGAVAPSSAFEAADLRIYKDDSATQRSSANGITMTSPFDSVTGLHHVAIDLSDDTDSGFYAAGSDYEVVLVPDETVDSQTVVSVLARFSIVTAAQAAAADGTDWKDGGRLDLLLDAVLADTGTDGVAVSAAAANVVADALLDRTNGVESGVTPRQALRALAAVLAGLASDGPGASVFKAIGAASGGTTRVTIVADANGDRSAVTLNL